MSYSILFCSVQGSGKVPGEMPAVSVSAVVGNQGSTVIPWTNPFMYPVLVDVHLEEEGAPPDAAAVLALLLKKSDGLLCPPSHAISIPVSFSPKALSVAHGTISVACRPAAPEDGDEMHAWRFPIVGHAEVEVRPRLAAPAPRPQI